MLYKGYWWIGSFPCEFHEKFICMHLAKSCCWGNEIQGKAESSYSRISTRDNEEESLVDASQKRSESSEFYREMHWIFIGMENLYLIRNFFNNLMNIFCRPYRDFTDLCGVEWRDTGFILHSRTLSKRDNRS